MWKSDYYHFIGAAQPNIQNCGWVYFFSSFPSSIYPSEMFVILPNYFTLHKRKKLSFPVLLFILSTQGTSLLPIHSVLFFYYCLPDWGFPKLSTKSPPTGNIFHKQKSLKLVLPHSVYLLHQVVCVNKGCNSLQLLCSHFLCLHNWCQRTPSGTAYSFSQNPQVMILRVRQAMLYFKGPPPPLHFKTAR